jgi:Flp pilus assembly protein TadD
MPSLMKSGLLPLLAAGLFWAVSCKGGSSPPPQAAPATAPQEAPGGADRATFLFGRGVKLLAEGQNEDAAKVLELAHQADPSSARIAVELARALSAGKGYDRAVKLLRDALASPTASDQEKTRGRELLVEILLDKGEVGPAEEACGPLLQGASVSATARRLSGMIAYRKGDPQSLRQAVTELKEAARLAPSDAETRVALGLALQQLEDLPGAASALEEASRLDPGSEAAASNLAKVYEMEGNSAKAAVARKRFQQIYDQKSVRQKVGPIRARGVEAFNAGRLDEALQDFQEVLKVLPKDAQALAQVGSVYLAMQKLDEAESHLKQAIEVRPDDDFALTEMGRVRALRNDLPGAVEYLQRAARSNPEAPEPHYFLAGIFYAQQRKEDFVREKEAFERLRKITPVPGVMELPEAPGP